MTDTSQFPVATRAVLLVLVFVHLGLFVLHVYTAPRTITPGSRRDALSFLLLVYIILIPISYCLTFREIEWRYDDPIKGQNKGQDVQNVRTGRTVLQLIGHTILYGMICIILNERVGALGLPQRLSGRVAKRFEGFILAATFIVGSARLSLASFSYRAFYGGQINWEDYQHRLVVARGINLGWVVLTGVFAINIVLRTVNQMINLRRMDIRDWRFGISVGEITGSPILLPALNDPTVTDSNIEYLEIITQISEAIDLLIIVLAVIWLLSDCARHHSELKDIQRPFVAANRGHIQPPMVTMNRQRKTSLNAMQEVEEAKQLA